MKKAVTIILLILFAGSLVYPVFSPSLYKREKNLVNDLRIMNTYIPNKDTVSVDEDSWNDLALQAYLYMQKKTNVEGNYSHKYYIHDREHNTVPNKDYKKIEIPTKQYDLYLKKFERE